MRLLILLILVALKSLVTICFFIIQICHSIVDFCIRKINSTLNFLENLEDKI